MFSVPSSFPKIARNGGDAPAVLVFRKGRRKRERKRHHFSVSLTLSLSKSALLNAHTHTMHKRFNKSEGSREILILYNLAAKKREFCSSLKKNLFFFVSSFLVFCDKRKRFDIQEETFKRR